MTEAQARKQVIEKCYEDLSYLGKVISPQTFYLDSPEFHAEIDEVLLDNSKIQVVREAPRGTAKSTKIIAKIIHHGLFEDGDKLVVIQSKTRPESINRLTKVKNIFEYSAEFKALFGYIGEQVATSWREDKIKVRIKNPLTGKVSTLTIKAIGTGQPTRGALEDDTRITLYILDDPDDEDNCLTKEQMDKNFSKFLGGIAGLDRRNGRVIVIGTPIREGCIVERLRDAPGWDTKVYQSYWTNSEGQTEVLWKEMYDYDWLMTKKAELEAVGMRSKFYSEYQCEIVGEEDKLLKGWKYFSGDVEVTNEGSFLNIKRRHKQDLPQLEKIAVNIFLGIDPASSTKASADYSVTFAVAYDADKNVYCLPYFRNRSTPTAHAEQIIQTIRAWKPSRAHVETIGYQEMLRNYLRMRMEEEELYVPGLETKFQPRTEKSARLDTLQPFFATGKIWLMEDMVELEDELNIYPRGKHDDLLDGLYYATRKLITPDHVVQGEQDDLRYFLRAPSTTKNWVRV